MDMASERLLLERLKATFTSDQTVIVTTHRVSMLALVNRLILIDRGKLLADGSRDEILALLARNPAQVSTPALNQASKDYRIKPLLVHGDEKEEGGLA
jgi:ATP-binding cassette subfamily C protein LapB